MFQTFKNEIHEDLNSSLDSVDINRVKIENIGVGGKRAKMNEKLNLTLKFYKTSTKTTPTMLTQHHL
jgi:hypothetical protein